VRTAQGWLFVAALAFGLGCGGGSETVLDADDVELDALGWLAGSWQGKTDSGETEEHWTPPRGGTMLGTSRTIADGRTVGYEFLRIEESPGGLIYHAQPSGQPSTRFSAVMVSNRRAVFVNRAHDFPQQITYEALGPGELRVRLEAKKGSETQAQEWTMDRVVSER
jgi:hypothetical protein